jgi:5-oxoprolinase (ATP-hydrolysing) subunit A
MKIDINCDMGEGFDANEVQIMPFITSANISCGYHAGTEAGIKKTIALAIQNGLKIGVHPSYLDVVNFGRTNQDLDYMAVYQLISQQILLFDKWLKELGGSLHHVKLHGALYNQTAQSLDLALAATQAVFDVNPELVFYGLAGSKHLIASQTTGLKAASEVFSDRSYQPNGSLTPRTESGALLTNLSEITTHVLGIVKNQEIKAIDGSIIKIKADTICIHGDGSEAVSIAKNIHEVLGLGD